ncbi:MAG: histone H1 [Planctomycetota bacterium]|nr:histone H1 [Planctomycetota bacterium]
MTTQNFQKLVQTIEATREDVEKAAAGNKAACARVRKAMQDVKNIAQDIRKEMLELRDGGGNTPTK